MYARVLVCLLVLACLMPLAQAQSANVRARIVPQFEEVALAPSEKANVPLEIVFEVMASCQSGTRFGVTLLMVDSFPKWAGASPQPASLQFDEKGGRKSAALELFPAEDAPPGQSVTYRLRPEVHLPSATNCTGEMRVESPDVRIKLTILSDDQTGGPADGGDSPGVGLPALALALGGCVLLRRRR